MWDKDNRPYKERIEWSGKGGGGEEAEMVKDPIEVVSTKLLLQQLHCVERERESTDAAFNILVPNQITVFAYRHHRRIPTSI